MVCCMSSRQSQVTEDVVEIILNIKELVVSSEHDEPVVMYLRKQGTRSSRPLTLLRFTGVEVHNPTAHRHGRRRKGKLEIELVVERGRGYRFCSAEQPDGSGNRTYPG